MRRVRQHLPGAECNGFSRTCRTLSQWQSEKGLDVWRPKFLAELRKSANVSEACRVSGIARVTAYDHRDRYEGFAAEWEEAVDHALDTIEGNVYRIAMDREDSRSALHAAKFVLSNRRRDRWNERQQLPDIGPVKVDFCKCSE